MILILFQVHWPEISREKFILEAWKLNWMGFESLGDGAWFSVLERMQVSEFWMG